jgi:hypothetical protein
MKKRIAKPDDVLAVLKVTQSDWYGHVRGFPYRVIAIQEKGSLYDLGLAILSSFRFDRDHLFAPTLLHPHAEKTALQARYIAGSEFD